MDAFLPGSQLDVKPIKDYDAYVGTRMDLKVVKINPQYRNIVVSHKAIIESDLEQQKTEILGKLEKGQVLEGVVKNLTSFGVFVDLGGVDGLIHITDVSWGRINHPEEVLELGQKINVVVLDYDEDKKRISLGMKQLTPHPWETLPEDIQEGSVVKGKVVNLEDYGAFIEIFPGVEGLVHVSEMSWSTHLKSPQEYVKLGDEVEAKVLSIDREERKLSLGLKQLTTDPWANIEEKYPVGSRHTATVRSMTNFGLFVELEEGIDGLVHISDLSWTKKFAHPAEFTKVGEKLDVVVLDLDKENRRLSLGHKQLEEDPWDTFESIFLEGSVHEGVLLTVEEKGATVGLPYGVEAFVPKKFLNKADKSKPRVDETLEFKVIEFDKSNRKIILSHSDVWRDEERRNNAASDEERKAQDERTRKDIKKVKSGVEKTTLADELDILQQLKNQMEQQDKVKQKEAMAKMDSKGDTKAETTGEEGAAEEAPAKPKRATKKKASDEEASTEATEGEE
jgi:small subunit ribosomal protein S1